MSYAEASHLEDPHHVLAAAIFAGFILLSSKRRTKIPSVEEANFAMAVASTVLIPVIRPRRTKPKER